MDKITNATRIIHALYVGNEKQTNNQLVESTGLDKKQVTRCIKWLRKNGLIKTGRIKTRRRPYRKAFHYLNPGEYKYLTYYLSSRLSNVNGNR